MFLCSDWRYYGRGIWATETKNLDFFSLKIQRKKWFVCGPNVLPYDVDKSLIDGDRWETRIFCFHVSAELQIFFFHSDSSSFFKFFFSSTVHLTWWSVRRRGLSRSGPGVLDWRVALWVNLQPLWWSPSAPTWEFLVNLFLSSEVIHLILRVSCCQMFFYFFHPLCSGLLCFRFRHRGSVPG